MTCPPSRLSIVGWRKVLNEDLPDRSSLNGWPTAPTGREALLLVPVLSLIC
jgi:hypothetical protein